MSWGIQFTGKKEAVIKAVTETMHELEKMYEGQEEANDNHEKYRRRIKARHYKTDGARNPLPASSFEGSLTPPV